MEPTGAAPLRPTDPREIGPYRLLGRLGEGGMGTVFLARAPGGRFVALKVVKSEFANQEGFAARFHAEVDNARRVASFCTAQVLDNGNSDEGRPYMVTEFIAGTPLSEQIARYGALEAGPLHGVALGVAAALAAIHVAGLVHRDLKPANVILSLSGPRVIDFGIARALDRETGFTLSGELLGSPGWWAPEQVRGEQVTPAADIFSWGCLVAYAGSGRHPFGRGDVITLATRVLNGPPEVGTLPAPLDDLVRRATAMDPAQRPTAQDLLLALVSGGAPAPAADPPTLAGTELLRDWQPPQNVVDSPDITSTFSITPTPPPRLPLTTTPVRATATPESPPDQDTTRDRFPTAPPVSAGQSTQTVRDLGRPEELLPPVEYATAPRADYAPDRPRTRGTRWLMAAAAAVLALALTTGVLIWQGSRNSPAVQNTPQAGKPAVTDVGRRFQLSSAFDGPQLIIATAPECGVAGYQGATPANGQLCLLRWTMLNPGGELTTVGTPALTLIDDRNGRHDPLPVSSQLPAALTAGGRFDGVFVFDLPPVRKAARLSGTMFTGGKQIEVRLS
ncbi:serine/threonine-protein kinase [Nonomuraea endophytica]|uniref:serine/threonine-protein kinase n=1 Tax=Nonomuraea endophytica TaxID=714136 RepID=UPI0037CB89B1